MKINKQFLGKLVEVTWRDPGHDRFKTHLPDHTDLPKGWPALATWVERGVLDDLTDGVLRILHSEGFEPGKEQPDEFVVVWVPETLVVKITTYLPSVAEAGAMGDGKSA